MSDSVSQLIGRIQLDEPDLTAKQLWVKVNEAQEQQISLPSIRRRLKNLKRDSRAKENANAQAISETNILPSKLRPLPKPKKIVEDQEEDSSDSDFVEQERDDEADIVTEREIMDARLDRFGSPISSANIIKSKQPRKAAVGAAIKTKADLDTCIEDEDDEEADPLYTEVKLCSKRQFTAVCRVREQVTDLSTKYYALKARFAVNETVKPIAENKVPIAVNKASIAVNKVVEKNHPPVTIITDDDLSLPFDKVKTCPCSIL